MDVQTILSGMNKQQKEAVLSTEGPLLVMAGAGSGKTRVLTHRIAYLIADKAVNPWNILAITFTNKAAAEMKERVGQLVADGGDDVWVSTFHSLCVRILRRDIDKIGYDRSYTIIGVSEQRTLMKHILKDLNIDPKRYPPRTILGTISQAKNELIDEKTYTNQASNYYERVVAQCYTAYQKQLRLAETVDFDDLIMLTVRLFREHPDVLAYYHRKFQYIHVDEYQDTNHAQYELIQLLAKRFRNICVVGDSDQSIYGWRGADMGNILNFEKDYPTAKTIFLEQNYRSTKKILAAANSVIQNNQRRPSKKLWTENPSGERITVYQATSGDDEAKYVAEKIDDLRNKYPELSFGDFAVLYRTNALSRVVEEAFINQNKPYNIIGGMGFYERKEIRDILAYLTLVVNPTDNLSFQRVVNEPKRGIGSVTVEKLSQAAEQQGISLYEIALNPSVTGLSPRVAEKVNQFAKMIRDFQQMADFLSVTELTETILERTGYIEALHNDKNWESRSRLENLEEFYSVTRQFDQEHTLPSRDNVLEFLTDLSLLAPADKIDPSEGAITLMTMHAAKGLEFPVVFIIGMEEGIFPNERLDDTEEELEEERRLAYVGITRAERKLFLTYTQSRVLYGRTQYHQVSRFIEEIDDDLIEQDLHVGETTMLSAPTSQKLFTKGRSGRGGRSQLTRNTPKKSTNQFDWLAGDRVQHKAWGEGTIVQVKEDGDDLMLDIAFEGRGLKKLSASFAPIEKKD